MLVMYFGWLTLRRRTRSGISSAVPHIVIPYAVSESSPLLRARLPQPRSRFHDLVDTSKIDLYQDEYDNDEIDDQEDEERKQRLNGPWGVTWKLFYLVA